MTMIGFTGRAGSGKTHLAEYMCSNYLAHPVAFADPLKLMVFPIATMLAGGDEDLIRSYMEEGKDKKMPKINCSARDLYRQIGDIMRYHNPDAFVHLTELKVNLVRQIYQTKMGRLDFEVPIIVTDIRYENEAQWVRDQCGVIIRINRPDDKLRVTHKHSSEQGIPNSYVNFEIDNDGSLLELNQFGDSLADMYDLERHPAQRSEKASGETMYVH